MANYTSYDQLPLALRAEDVAQILGISRAGAYALFHAEGFPCIRIGKRILVQRDAFLQWVDMQYRENERKATAE